MGTPAIASFSGEYRFLSNFWYARVQLDGDWYAHTEGAYQAAKTTDRAARKAFRDCKPGEAKKLGRTLAIRPDWDAVKLDVMRDLIAQKFAPGTKLAAQLLATGDAELIEGNVWGDTFWGVCRGIGANNLGKLLMQQRAVLQATQTRTIANAR